MSPLEPASLLRTLPLLLLAACAGGPNEETSASANSGSKASDASFTPEKHEAPGELVIAAGMPFGINQLDPVRWRTGWSEASSLYLGRLFETGVDGSIEPDLATSVVSPPGGNKAIIHLAKNAVWHDGKPFVAEDVIATFRWIFAKPEKTRVDNELAAVNAYRAVDDHTVELELSRPWPRIAAQLSRFPILRPDTLGGPGFPMGTGAYRIVERSKDGDDLLFVAHERYHRKPAPSIKKIRLRYVPSDSERADLFAHSQVHLANVREQSAAELGGVVRLKGGSWRGLVFNGKTSWLADVRVRKAISLAIDRHSLVEDAMEGFGRIATLPTSPSTWIYPEDVPAAAYDPDRARELIKEAGVEGKTLRLLIWRNNRFHRRTDFLLMLALEGIGLKLKGDLAETEAFSSMAQNMGEDLDAYIGGWNVLVDPIEELEKKFHTKGSQNYFGYSDSETDKLIEAALAEPDQQKAAGICAEVLKRVTNAYVIVPLVYPDYFFAKHPMLAGIDEGMVLDSWREITRFSHRWTWEPSAESAAAATAGTGSLAGASGSPESARGR